MATKIKNKQFVVVSDFDINNQRLINVDAPLDSSDGVNKDFIDTNAINYALTTGLYSGGTLSIAGNDTFNVAAGLGYIVDPQSKEITSVTWDAFTGVSLMTVGATDITVSVAIDSNGDIFQQIPKFSAQQRNDMVVLGELFIHPTLRVLGDVIFYPVLSRDLQSTVDRCIVSGPQVESGNNVTANGANLLMDVSSGTIFGYAVNAIHSLDIPNFSEQDQITGVSFFTTYYDGTEWVFSGATDSLDPSVWSNGTASLQSATPAKFNLRILYRSATDGDAFIIGYPTQTVEYDNIQEAESSLNALGVDYPPELFGITVPLAWIIQRGNATDLSDSAEAKIVPIQSVSVAAGSVATVASNVSYDPTSSTNLQSTDVQDAVEVINNRVESTEFSSSNLDMTALSGTSGIYLATSTTITDAVYTFTRVSVNGVAVKVGDGTTLLCDCFFSDDGGSTAKSHTDIAQGDALYWNGDVAYYQLETTDRLDFIYLTRTNN